MSAIRNRQRFRANEYIAYFGDPYGFRRTIALYLWDALLELRAARRQARRGAHRPRGDVSADEGRDYRDHARPQRRDPAR